MLRLACAQAGHALIGALMPEYDPVTKISIVPRGAAGGLTFFAPSDERLDSGLYRWGPPGSLFDAGQLPVTLRANQSCMRGICTHRPWQGKASLKFITPPAALVTAPRRAWPARPC